MMRLLSTENPSSVGSITFCGSLAHDCYRNPVSRILENVVRRFAARRAPARGRDRGL